ncbi:MAG: DNA mismatch repair protein MutS [Acidobacteria bacterium]|nr:DNA mismatch repair protein MutS [Acidobacteriota bacterium]
MPLLFFAGLVIAHARVLNARDRAARAVSFYERGLARLEERWAGTGEPGERFRAPDHPFADDLDLFGRGSLFELLSTPRTKSGEATLAAWLLHPAQPDEIGARQAAVLELTPHVAFREEISILGPDVTGVDTAALVAWANGPARLTARWAPALLAALAVLSVAMIGVWIWSGEPPGALLPVLGVQGVVAWRFRHAVHEVVHGVERREHELAVLTELLRRLERETFTSPRLVRLAEALASTGRVPSIEIGRLARLVDVLASRHNLLFGPIAAVLALGTQLAFAVDRWRARCGPAVKIWLDVLAEFEALSALATYTFEHPSDPMPEVVAGRPRFDATAVGHPLIPKHRGVANDVVLGGGAAHVLLVSGSNMSGKSTLLRTVGINAVLAQAGAPVRAKALRMTPLAIGATLRIQDSLQAGRSRFYAEISRISQIVALARRAEPSERGVLFLLDEVLAGTNSHDRRQGAEAIVSGLVDLGAIGLVTTHDLALADLVARPGLRAANVHFEDRFENGELQFDYRLKPGVVQTSNAIALMRSVGLDV